MDAFLEWWINLYKWNGEFPTDEELEKASNSLGMEVLIISVLIELTTRSWLAFLWVVTTND